MHTTTVTTWLQSPAGRSALALVQQEAPHFARHLHGLLGYALGRYSSLPLSVLDTADMAQVAAALGGAVLLSTAQAATRLGVQESRVRQLCARGQLPATKAGRDWVILTSAVDAFQPRPAGRPPLPVVPATGGPCMRCGRPGAQPFCPPCYAAEVALMGDDA